MKKHLLEAKKSLYLLLIGENIAKLSESEVDLMYTLSKDEDIQRTYKKEEKEISLKSEFDNYHGKIEDYKHKK